MAPPKDGPGAGVDMAPNLFFHFCSVDWGRERDSVTESMIDGAFSTAVADESVESRAAIWGGGWAIGGLVSFGGAGGANPPGTEGVFSSSCLCRAERRVALC